MAENDGICVKADVARILNSHGCARRRTPMMMNPITTERLTEAKAAQKVVIVNGSTEILQMLETVLEAGHYDIVFVESSERAYSQIKRVKPNLVILCVRMDDFAGLQVLSMLKLDRETERIPVLTYTTEIDGGASDDNVADEEPSDNEMFTAKAAVRMN
jgi:PleD family two-component response regulator